MWDPPGPTLGLGEEEVLGLGLLGVRAGEGGSDGAGDGDGDGEGNGEGEADGDRDGCATWLGLGAPHDARSRIRHGRSTEAGRTGASRGVGSCAVRNLTIDHSCDMTTNCRELHHAKWESRRSRPA